MAGTIRNVRTRACSHKKSVKNQSQSKNRKINNIKLVAASKNLAKILKTFNFVASFVELRVIFSCLFLFFRRKIGTTPRSSARGYCFIVSGCSIH